MHPSLSRFPNSPTSWNQLFELRESLEKTILSVLDCILERHDQNPGYPFINTKFSVLTGEDFAPRDSILDFKGPSAVFGWIQGRGLEALSLHARWLDRSTTLSAEAKARTRQRISAMVNAVKNRLEEIRENNNGRLSFLFSPEGKPFGMNENGHRCPISLDKGESGYADLFYAKGLLAASSFLGHAAGIQQAKKMFRKVATDIENGAFVSDQIGFDPKNPVRPVPGKIGHGPRMIAIGGFALFADLLNEKEWFDFGERFIAHILARHVNQGRFPKLELYDLVEFITPNGKPWQQGDAIPSDPGHDLEFVGLASKFLLCARKKSHAQFGSKEADADAVKILPHILLRNFQNGFNPVGGICKLFDLVSRTPMNSDMPWWSLPETLRAASGVALLTGNKKISESMLGVAAVCAQGFLNRFVNPRAHFMAYQTLNERGEPIDVVPATPDADPGYHTGLSLIDFLDHLEILRKDS